MAEAASSGLLADADVGDTCRRTLDLDAGFREGRSARGTRPQAAEPEPAPGPPEEARLTWTVHSAANTRTLPGTPVRDEDDAAPSGDITVDEAWEGVRATLVMLSEVFGRTSYDDAGARVSATVHFGQDYQNAFWDGTQLVFGDGDGRIFNRFTIAVDILAHELGHAVTERTAGLVYQGQSGALNESMSDVFGSCLKQRVLGQDAMEADWLIGEGLFTDAVRGAALRSMSQPGTAYDDPVLGRDPQPAHLDDYIDTTDDNGGVHLNSGIPNRAFYLAATGIGGSSAEGAGRIWYEALLTAGPATDFAGFAAATLAVAGAHAEVVRGAWRSVGVPVGEDAGRREDTRRDRPSTGPGTDQESGGPGEPSGTGQPAGVVRVRRSGGLAGMTATSSLDLDRDDPRAREALALVRRVDIALLARQADAGTGQPGRPDAFTYQVACGGHEATVPEDRATPDLVRLVELVLAVRDR
ncbi:protealysin inhibitor emfourin [Myceligenerans indicum]|uniref:protealysin inhibitor emfourin n=1 Tax=Myceligenerans indicum TaxID=2593663 RepID=UPI0027DB7245|nr:protealysin inhibitor emfourin [Myceligenerans indicum]